MDLNARIIDTTIQMLMQMGVSSMTMDAIAKSCGISKRTLYEHFPDKLTLITEAMHQRSKQQKEKLDQIFHESSNQLDALLRVYTEVRKQVSHTSFALINDIRRLYPSLYKEYEMMHYRDAEALIRILEQGKKEGFVRDDAEIEISVKLFSITACSTELPRLSYDNDIPLVKVLDTLFINFLRSIASKKGITFIEEYLNNTHENNIIIKNND